MNTEYLLQQTGRVGRPRSERIWPQHAESPSGEERQKAKAGREYISEVEAELWKISDDILVLTTSTGSPRC